MYNDGSAGSSLFVYRALNFGHRSTRIARSMFLTSTKILEGILIFISK